MTAPAQPLTRYLKFLTKDGRGPYSEFEWPLGEWVEAEGDLDLCSNGLHFCTIDQALRWLDARCHTVEVRGELLDGGDKVCVRAAKLGPTLTTWNERTARLLAADYAERVLPLFESARPNDPRVRDCIATVRSFADGVSNQDELNAAGAAAGAAGGDVERKWQIERLRQVLTGEIETGGAQ